MSEHLLTDERIARASVVSPSWWSRTRARVGALRYDRELEEGRRVTPGTPLSVHAARLASVRERRELAASLFAVMDDAHDGRPERNRRVPVDVAAVRRAADVVDAVLVRLEPSHPARIRGVARLRILLADGRGPLYRAGAGSLDAAMRGVLAAL
ncbi:hypothetical protein [Mycolicibacterium sediminis]|uniref:Uncharacterized protein n=1 Tax=Mycolicibacterium sediminis TaxID=1286180 RepID=A0A7I7QUY2_9MYCO|nr:hypothetical protein [Mycolicibacterium sediminis]BBY30111.1 hypothetical protein MSEDJ_42070 [Mycolicibacterium sediminis]